MSSSFWPGKRHQILADGQIGFPDDGKVRGAQHGVVREDRPGHGVLDGHDGVAGLPLLHDQEEVTEGLARHRGDRRGKVLRGGFVVEGSGDTLYGDGKLVCVHIMKNPDFRVGIGCFALAL